MSYELEMTWGWVINDIIFIFGWTNLLSGSRWKERLLNHECLWMTDGMTLAQIPWRPFQNSKLLKQSIGVSRLYQSVQRSFLKGQRRWIVKERECEREREREQMFGHWDLSRVAWLTSDPSLIENLVHGIQSQ